MILILNFAHGLKMFEHIKSLLEPMLNQKKNIFQYLFSATSSNYFFRPYIKICINKTHYTARLSVCKMAVSLLSTNHKSFHGVFVFFQNKTSNAYEKYSISYILIVSSKALPARMICKALLPNPYLFDVENNIKLIFFSAQYQPCEKQHKNDCNSCMW